MDLLKELLAAGTAKETLLCVACRRADSAPPGAAAPTHQHAGRSWGQTPAFHLERRVRKCVVDVGRRVPPAIRTTPLYPESRQKAARWVQNVVFFRGDDLSRNCAHTYLVCRSQPCKRWIVLRFQAPPP